MDSKKPADAEKLCEYPYTKEQGNKLRAQDRTLMENCFRHYDSNNDANMDKKEFTSIMKDLGQVSRKGSNNEAVQSLIEKYDQDKDGGISWVEFIDMMVELQGKGVKVDQAIIEEVFSYAASINVIMKGEEQQQFMKDYDIDIDQQDPGSLFDSMASGLLLCRLCNMIDSESIMEKSLTKKKTSELSIFQMRLNLNAAISACKVIGVKVVAVGADNFVKKDSSHVLGIVWQVVRLHTTKAIDLSQCEEIFRLLQGDETLEDLNRLTPEQILIRWINYHLAEAGVEKRVENLGKDLKDSVALTYVLNQIDKEKCALSPLDETNMIKRAQGMIDQSKNIEVPTVVRSMDICNGNVRTNTLFCSYIFNTKHGLKPLDEEQKAAFAKWGIQDNENPTGSIEERQYRQWINSLNLPDQDVVTSLFDDVRDGVLLNRIIDKIQPGCVDWKLVRNPPKTIFDKNNNNGNFVKTSKEKLGLKMIAIGGDKLAQGATMDTLAAAWQLCLTSYLKLIGGISEKDIVQWANDLVGDKYAPITNLKDKSMSNGLFLLHLIGSIEARAIDWEEIVTKGESEDDKTLNAKYIISLTRQLGGTVFCVWDQIVSVHPKQMLILFCALKEVKQNYEAPAE